MDKRMLVGATVLSVTLFANCGPSADKQNKPEAKPEKKHRQEKIIKEPVKLASGLKYKIIKHGTIDKTPQPGQKVTVHYAGWLEENGNIGKKFDSSVDRGQKFTFTIGVGQVIKGWDEGVIGMKVGEKRRLFIPYNLAYGERGIPGVIPPKSMLIFDVELFGIA